MAGGGGAHELQKGKNKWQSITLPSLNVNKGKSAFGTTDTSNVKCGDF